MPPARQRAAASALAALFATAPLCAAEAYASPAPPARWMPLDSGAEVVFSGDRSLLGVSCEARPSSSSVSVPAESTLRVVNRTGHRAKLLIDGATQGEIENGGAAPVVFHRGPVELGLKPNCMLAEESAVRVEVLSTSRTSSPAPPPVGSPSGAPGAATGDPRNPAPDRPGRPTETPTRPSPSPSQAPTPAESAGSDAGLGEDVTDEDLTVPAADEDGPGGTEGVAAEALSAVQPVRESGPIGLLAIIATVCAVGVSAGAIRAIIAQRASRTGAA